jgi:septum formation protein
MEAQRFGIKMKIVLASTSPRRLELLRELGLRVKVVDSRVRESKFNISDPEKLVKTLALTKAKEVARRVRGGLIIGADTIVVLKGKILGKPKDEEEAKSMLRELSGKTHEVLTGLAVIDASTGKTKVDFVRSRVKLKRLSEGEISNYVVTDKPFDKAGAYSIQEKAGLFVEKIDGCYFNVVGLPLARLAEILKEFNVTLV